MRLTLGSLCSGIGGLEYGLEQTGGFKTMFQAEIDPYARRVLEKHWPGVQRLEDVRDVSGQSVPRVDLIAAGLPCQPHSLAGRRQSSNDGRDLWAEFARIVGDLEPRWLLVENVPGLLSSADPAYGNASPGAYFGRILSDLDALGYDAEWTCLRAGDFGAQHCRERLFLLAYPHGAGREEQYLAPLTGGPGLDTGAAGGQGREGHSEPPVLRVADDVPARIHRLRTLGNAVVPPVARWIGERILGAERAL